MKSASIGWRAEQSGVTQAYRRWGARGQGWQYGTVRSQFAYRVPRTLNRTIPAYRISVQFLKRTAPTYRTLTKKAYRTSVPYF